MSEAISLQKSYGISEYLKQMKSKVEYFKKQKIYYENIVNYHSEFLENINSIQDNLNKISIQVIPDIEYFIYRNDLKYSDNQNMNLLFREWNKCNPFLNTWIMIKQSDLKDKNDNYDWGLSIEAKWAETLNIRKNKYVKHLNSCKVIHSIIKTGGENTFSHDLLAPVLQYAKDNKLTIKKDIFGKILLRIYESGEYSRYLEIYIPFYDNKH